METLPFLGAHFSVAGGLENALYTAADLECRAAQIFTKNARSWKDPVLSPEQILVFKTAREETQIEFVASHCTYLINMAATDQDKRQKSIASLKAEMVRSTALGLDAVVLHPGAHMGAGVKNGILSAVDALTQVLDSDNGAFPVLLLETTAGSGTCLGSSFRELGELISGLGAGTRIGVCLDTSHIFAAGYDIRTPKTLDQTLETLDREVGLSRLMLIHLNDSVPELGSRKDRHAHIGLGKIGETGFRAIMRNDRLSHIPKILETPKDLNGTSMDPVNLNRLRQLTH